MKITQQRLEQLIREAISLPRLSDVDPDLAMKNYSEREREISDEFLYDTHAGSGPATIQLTKSQQHDYSREGMNAYMQRIGAMTVSDNQAMKITRSMDSENHPITYKLKDMLSDAYFLVTEMDEFMNHVQRRNDDQLGRKVLVVMGSDASTVVFKDRDSPNYYVYRG
jgi:lipopolysaccharide biosynthesis regulator YciM